MKTKPPQSPDTDDDDDDSDDPSVRLVDALFEDAALEAAANPGPPSEAAHRLSRLARGGFPDGYTGGDEGVPALGSTDGELDTARIRAMDRAQLVATLASLKGAGDEAGGDVDETATDEQLRGAVRELRSNSLTSLPAIVFTFLSAFLALPLFLGWFLKR